MSLVDQVTVIHSEVYLPSCYRLRLQIAYTTCVLSNVMHNEQTCNNLLPWIQDDVGLENTGIERIMVVDGML